jgi:hypothetical protein
MLAKFSASRIVSALVAISKSSAKAVALVHLHKLNIPKTRAAADHCGYSLLASLSIYIVFVLIVAVLSLK